MQLEGSSLSNLRPCIVVHGFSSYGLDALWHVGSQFPDEGLNSHPLHCKVDS